MRSADFLFKFVQALSEKERVYVLSKLKKQNHIPIYHWLSKQLFLMKDYNGQKLSEQMGKKFPSANLIKIKHKLYEKMLEILTEYDGAERIKTSLKQKLKTVQVLFDKELFREAYSQLLEVKEIALKHELQLYLFEIYRWELDLLRLVNLNQSLFSGVKEICVNLGVIRHHLKQEIQLLKMVDALSLLHFNPTYYEVNKVNDLAKSLLQKCSKFEKVQELPIESQFMYHRTRYFAFNQLAQNEELQKESTALLRLFQQNPWYIQQHPRRWLAALSNHTLTISKGKQYQRVPELLEKHLKYQPAGKTNQVLFFEIYYRNHILYLVETGQEHKVDAVAQKAFQFYEQYPDHQWQIRSTVLAYIGRAAFVLGDFQNAVLYFRKTTEILLTPALTDMRNTMSIMNVISLYECREYGLFDSRIRALQYLQKKTKLDAFPINRVLMKFLRALIKADGDKSAEAKLASNLHHKIKKMPLEKTELSIVSSTALLPYLEKKMGFS